MAASPINIAIHFRQQATGRRNAGTHDSVPESTARNPPQLVDQEAFHFYTVAGMRGSTFRHTSKGSNMQDPSRNSDPSF